MAFVGMLRKMLKDPEIGKLVVPIVPDEARTFGMESLFRTVGIYSSVGKKYVGRPARARNHRWRGQRRGAVAA